MIYGIVEENDYSVVKIGYTGTPGEAVDDAACRGRMGGHQVSNWRRLVCIAMAPGPRSLEKELHHEFDHYCVRGEWFLNHGEVSIWLERWRLPAPLMNNEHKRHRRPSPLTAKRAFIAMAPDAKRAMRRGPGLFAGHVSEKMMGALRTEAQPPPGAAKRRSRIVRELDDIAAAARRMSEGKPVRCTLCGGLHFNGAPCQWSWRGRKRAG